MTEAHSYSLCAVCREEEDVPAQALEQEEGLPLGPWVLERSGLQHDRLRDPVEAVSITVRHRVTTSNETACGPFDRWGEERTTQNSALHKARKLPTDGHNGGSVHKARTSNVVRSQLGLLRPSIPTSLAPSLDQL